MDQQQKVLATSKMWLNSHSSTSCQIWDITAARFHVCSFPYIAAIATLFVLATLLCRLLWPLWRRIQPQWTKPFVVEDVSKQINSSPDWRHQLRRSWPSTSLLGFSSIGLVTSAFTAFHPQKDVSMLLLAAAWAFSILLIALEQPRKFSATLLFCFLSIFIASSILLVDSEPLINDYTNEIFFARILEVAASFFTVFVEFILPMRNPDKPTDQIGKAYGEPSSDLRSPEDNLNLWQWFSVAWISRLLKRAGQRKLNDEDVWSLSYEFQHRQLHDNFRQLQGSVLVRLLKANGLDLVIRLVFSLFYSATVYARPILLQRLLYSWGDPSSPVRATIKYAFLQLVVEFISAQNQVLSLWYSRRTYERARGEMITMIYEKTLARKIIVNNGKQDSTSEENVENGQINGTPKASVSNSGLKKQVSNLINVVCQPFSYVLRKLSGEEFVPEDTKKPASYGKILNLMRNDVYEVAQCFWDVDSIVDTPLGIILSSALIWILLGPSCFIGILTIIVAQILTYFLSKLMLRWDRIRRSVTDARLQYTSQMIESIRHLRWYAWQKTWVDRIMTQRQRELNMRIVVTLYQILVSILNTFASGLFPVVAFTAYTLFSGQSLRIDIAFPALRLFSRLDQELRVLPHLITEWLSAIVAMGRIEDFMAEPDKNEPDGKETYGDRLATSGASFCWPGTSKPVLENLTLDFPFGLNLVIGKVGSGKTALLQSLLGELDLTHGELLRGDMTIAYCGQTPWLENMSIRDNILFAAPFEDKRYKQVLDVCALTPDLAAFKQGDLSFIGENGIGLSGGQKARVALARAFYSTAKTILLDDPISALDHTTAKSIVQKAFAGDFLSDRRIILVTHRTELCSQLAVKIVEIHSGTARIITKEAALAKGIQRVDSAPMDQASTQQEEIKKKEEQEAAAVPDKFIEEEHRAEGGVRLAVYWQYIKAGKLKWWALNFVALALFRLVTVARSWLFKQWGEAYDRGNTPGHGLFGNLPSPAINLHPWLVLLFFQAVAYSLILMVSRTFVMIIVYNTGRQMFATVIDRVVNTRFRFYDVTPVGRLMNRLTSDMGTCDGDLSYQLHSFTMDIMSWCVSVAIIASITPAFLVFSLLATVVFVYIFRQFLSTSQNLRRLEMVSLSPLMSNFGALLDGLMTVRAYRAQGRFQARNIAVVDAFQKMDHFYWIVQTWLMYRFDILSAISIFLLTLLAIYTNVTAGLAAFVLLAAEDFVEYTHDICRQYGQIEMDFTAVERVVELMNLDQEPKGQISPPAVWPSTKGDITFEDVTIKYAEHMEPALANVSFTIKGGSNAAIVGRTGSGKSTLAISLLATILPTTGRILIDGIDLASIDPHVLRSRLTFLAQDPLLFEGSIRDNLDPLEEHSDEECATALDRVCESDSSESSIEAGENSSDIAKGSQHQSTWKLSTHVEAGGRNFSQGQRQLVGLARAILRRSSIIILDEATASIDVETSMRIQQVLRQEMTQSTVLTIAHRVEAVKDAETAVVLSKGRLQEFREAS